MKSKRNKTIDISAKDRYCYPKKTLDDLYSYDLHMEYTNNLINKVKPLLKPNTSLYNCCDWTSSFVKGGIIMKWKLPLIIIGVVVAIILLFIFGFQGVKNKAISYEEQISTAQSEIKVQEKRRADLLPNLVECVKAYDKHEYQTLMDIISARGAASDESVSEAQAIISAVAEAYPELKSSSNYKELMNELATTENLIANYRSNYNSWVKKYNQYVRKFPNRQALSFLGYEVINYSYLDYNAPVDAPINLFD